MLQRLLQMKNKKGFTLVEVIVVLVIIAILAALLIPALTGYIDKANERRYIAEARMVLLAAQTVISEKYGLTISGDFEGGTIAIGDTETAGGSITTADITDIEALAELDAGYDTELTFNNSGNIDKDSFTFTKGDYTVTFVDGAWVCEKAAETTEPVAP